MELYLAIAIGVTLGELGKKLIWLFEDLAWRFRTRKNPDRYRFVPGLDEEKLLNK